MIREIPTFTYIELSKLDTTLEGWVGTERRVWEEKGWELWCRELLWRCGRTLLGLSLRCRRDSGQRCSWLTVGLDLCQSLLSYKTNPKRCTWIIYLTSVMWHRNPTASKPYATNETTLIVQHRETKSSAVMGLLFKPAKGHHSASVLSWCFQADTQSPWSEPIMSEPLAASNRKGISLLK